MHYRVERSLRALADAQTIFNYIKERESIERANYVLDGIDETINRAAIHPTKHRIDSAINLPHVRFTIKWHYKIVFQVTQKTIRVLSIFHTAQNPDKLLR